LAVVAALLGLNGLGWFFYGPESSVSGMAESLGLTVAAFDEAHPAAADQVSVESRWVAVFLTSLGAMAFLASLAGLQTGQRWAWRITWVLVVTIGMVFVVVSGEGFGAFSAVMLALLLVALTGQLLARRPLT
jgi:hypothetical protein